MTIPRTQEMRKRESRTRGVSPGVLCVVLVKTKSMTKSESVSDPMILTTPLLPPRTDTDTALLKPLAVESDAFISLSK